MLFWGMSMIVACYGEAESQMSPEMERSAFVNDNEVITDQSYTCYENDTGCPSFRRAVDTCQYDICCNEPLEGRCKKPCNRFCVGGSAFYGVMRLGGISKAFGDTKITRRVEDGIVTTLTKETDQQPEFDWRLGFRVWASYEPCGPFTLAATWIHTTGKSDWHGSHHQEGLWKGKYDVVDGILGYNLSFIPCITLKPYLGVRGGWIKSDLSSRLVTSFTTDTEKSLLRSTTDNHSKFWGVGAIAGIYSEWQPGCGFSLFGNLTAGSLYGDFKTHCFHANHFPNDEDIFSDHRHSRECTLVIDSSIGAQWKTNICCTDVALSVAWEQHHWLDFNKFCTGDLCLDGITLGAHLCF